MFLPETKGVFVLYQLWFRADFGVGVIQVISVPLIDLVGRKILLSVGGVLLKL